MIAHVNNADLFYTTLGKGTPLMLMHGGMGLDHTYFRPWLDPLAGQLELIFYDHRGNGRSTPLEDFTGIDHTIWADDADALRRYLGHGKMILLGYSCGGFVAIDYALRYQKYLSGLILCCTVPAMDYPEVVMANVKDKATPEQLQLVLKMFTTPLESNDEFRDAYRALLPMYFKSYDPKTGNDIVSAAEYAFQAYNHGSAKWFPSVNFLSRLSEITVPTLVIGGRHDWIMPPAQGAERLHAALPNSEMAIFENSGHYPFIEEQHAFNEQIAGWIAGLSRE